MDRLLEASLPASSVSLEVPYSIDDSIGIDSALKLVEPAALKSDKRPFMTYGTASLPLLTALTLFLVVASICGFPLLKSAEPEARGRRLASNGEDDYPMPPSPELELLCLAATDWTPADPSSTGPRESPAMVELVLREAGLLPEDDSLVAPSEEAVSAEGMPGAESGMGGFTAGADAPPHGDSDQEEAGPSWRFPQPSAARQDPAPPLPSAAPPVPYPALSSGQGLSPPLSVEAQAAHPSGPFPPPPAPPGPAGGPVHPFIRLPVLQPGVTPRPWRVGHITAPLPLNRSRHPVLLQMRLLFLKPSLDAADLERLMVCTEQLANHALRRLSAPCQSQRPSDFVRERGLRLMVLDAVHSALRVTGQPLPLWWRYVVHAVLSNITASPPPIRRASSSAGNRKLAEDLREALLQYKADGPPPEEVLRLKRLLLCGPEVLACFQDPQWQPWRDDDRLASEGFP